MSLRQQLEEIQQQLQQSLNENKKLQSAVTSRDHEISRHMKSMGTFPPEYTLFPGGNGNSNSNSNRANSPSNTFSNLTDTSDTYSKESNHYSQLQLTNNTNQRLIDKLNNQVNCHTYIINLFACFVILR